MQRRTIEVLLIACGLLFVGELQFASAATSAGGITLVSPEDGATVRPGAVLPVQVQLDPSIAVESVHVWTKRSLLPDLDFAQAPYEGTLSIPNDFTGQITLTVFVRKPDMTFVDGPTITLNVIPTEAPTSIEAGGIQHLEFPSQSPVVAHSFPVRGRYTNGVTRIISGSRYGNIYASSDPEVVTVDAEGRLTATGSGVAFITITNGAAKTFMPVVVDRTDGQPIPAKDCTSRVSIAASGFRVDPETRFFVQELTIRNTSNLPIAFPINLVISDLPEGVRLENRRGTTRIITPIRSSVAGVKFAGGELYFAPGATATAILKFSNREGRPITHQVRLFNGVRL